MSQTTEISETSSNCRPSTNISNNVANDLPKSTKCNTFSGKVNKNTNENTSLILEMPDEQNSCDILRDLKTNRRRKYYQDHSQINGCAKDGFE